jgi:DNA helicase-2/ATP-dependent DNA helicase PcrA
MTLVLNDAQQRAVAHPSGPLLVVAGAGTGKTRMLTARIATLIERGAAAPHQIFAVTFTNKAAREMRERVEALLGLEPRGLWIGTFHALAARLLRIEATRLGFAPGFTIYDEDDQVSLVRRLLERIDCSPKAYPPRAIRSIISHAKNRMIPPAELEREAFDPLTRTAARVYALMGEALRSANAMDFDDLLIHPLTLFRENPDRLAVWQGRFRHVLVDEFQDTNRAQYDLVRLLAMRHGNLCVVGDDDQAIYGWRGADVRHMLDFSRDFPGTTVIRLEENYRSTRPILDAANTVIAGNTGRLGKTLSTTRPGGVAVTVYAAGDERDEAEWVARELAEAHARGESYRDTAVLYRTNAQSRAFEEAFCSPICAWSSTPKTMPRSSGRCRCLVAESVRRRSSSSPGTREPPVSPSPRPPPPRKQPRVSAPARRWRCAGSPSCSMGSAP